MFENIGGHQRLYLIESDSGPGPATGPAADPGRSLRHAKARAPRRCSPEAVGRSHTSDRSNRRGARAAPLLAVLLAVAAALVGPARALAHGDPTAHYLETDSLLTSYAAPPDLAVELQLRGVIDAAAARGYPIKVVLFSSEEGHGRRTWAVRGPAGLRPDGDRAARVHRAAPRTGADRHTARVRPGRPAAARRRAGPDHAAARGQAHAGLPLAKKAQGTSLARAAMTSIRRLAAAGGHPLPKRIPPAKQNLNGILGSAAVSRRPNRRDGPDRGSCSSALRSSPGCSSPRIGAWRAGRSPTPSALSSRTE